jgi:hypothetical protein
MIEKYEAKLEFLNRSMEKTKHLLDDDTLEFMSDLRKLLEEVIFDFRKVGK